MSLMPTLSSGTIEEYTKVRTYHLCSQVTTDFFHTTFGTNLCSQMLVCFLDIQLQTHPLYFNTKVRCPETAFFSSAALHSTKRSIDPLLPEAWFGR